MLSELVFFAHLGIYSFVPNPKTQLSIDFAGGCLSGEWVNGVLEGSVIETLASGGKVIINSSSIVFVIPFLISMVDTRWKDGARQEFGMGLTGRQGTSFQHQNS